MIARRAYMVTVLWTGSDRFGQVRTGVKRYFSSTMSCTLSKFGPSPNLCAVSNRTSLETLWPSEVVETALRHPSFGLRCELVWSATFLRHFQKRYVIGKLLFSRVRMWNFTRIGPKTKMLWLSIIPALRRSRQPRLGQPQKGVNRNFSWPQLDKLSVFVKPSISEDSICSFSMIGQKIKKKWLLLIIPALRWSYQPRLGQPQKGVNRNISWAHFDKSYVVRKFLTSEA